MNLPRHVTTRSFTIADAEPIAALLRASTPAHARHFRPFAYEASPIADLVSRNQRDAWFIFEVASDVEKEIAGFSMLRGLDEGFAEPMFGVFVAEKFAGHGLGRLTLAHAEAHCHLNGIRGILLKVNPENTRALRLYESAGFVFLRYDPRHGEHVLRKSLSPS